MSVTSELKNQILFSKRSINKVSSLTYEAPGPYGTLQAPKRHQPSTSQLPKFGSSENPAIWFHFFPFRGPMARLEQSTGARFLSTAAEESCFGRELLREWRKEFQLLAQYFRIGEPDAYHHKLPMQTLARVNRCGGLF
jgi:hypothetical protein